ncbi:haloacid dehalogenase [Vulcanisaeta souniana]|uniref:Haloacid dehalogenase n=1 Tax=Vulcanisaeta souniana JCM 11219 TaxID=1293586 RepID=A0A830E3S3_9CREN|nr:haloacid dehalogenase [Vulcanisaeta souniana]BDR92955.1 haloacid dehalogenase [Vulcanisaeta souniana JCM 11219]GGI83945.1 haloacid dehalogenase [Vulcanisaeta souniana JCM 11219]
MIETERLRTRLRELEEVKDEVIGTGVKVNRLSKSVIYSLIRDDVETARKHIGDMQRLVNKLRDLITKYPMYYNNAVISLQEYVEAMTMWFFITENRIPGLSELGVDAEPYVNGIADFTGELSRKATEEMIKNNLDFALRAKRVMEELYLDLLSLEPRDYEMRKKVDYVSSNINWLNEKIFYKTLNIRTNQE